jgi:hypothetical protein
MMRVAKIAAPVSAALLLALGAGQARAGAVAGAVGPGEKTIQNTSTVSMTVTLAARDASQHCCVSLPGVTAVIPAGQSAPITYGSAANPFLNELVVEVTVPKGADIFVDYVTTRGGRLNDLFNTNSIIVIGYRAGTLGFTLSGHN